MRIAVLLLLNLLAQHVSANDLLWQKLRTEADLVVLMRHTQPAGGNPLAWDESGSCKGESMLTVEGKALRAQGPVADRQPPWFDASSLCESPTKHRLAQPGVDWRGGAARRSSR